MKARLAGGRWSTVAEFKAAIQAEWDRIKLVEIRHRLAEMPERCRFNIEQPQKRIQSALW